MFLATLKELNLFVLPKPNFDIPASDFDHICPQTRTGDPDLSCVSQAFDMQHINQKSSALEGIETPRKKRRNTIAFPLYRVRESLWPSLSQDSKRPRSTAYGPSIAELQDSTIASIMHTRSSEPIRTSSGAKVRIITPANSPSSIRRRLREDMSLYICSPNRDRSRTRGSQTKEQKSCEKKENTRYGSSRKGKEKRNSAPLALPSAVFRTNEPISPSRLPPPVVKKYQNQRLRSHQDIASNSSYPSKLFELDLSPIIEDVYAFSDQLPAHLTERGQTDGYSADSPLDSSTTSYGELLYDKLTNLPQSADYFGLSDFDSFGHHDQERQWVGTVEHQTSQQWRGLTLASMREEKNCPPGDILPKLTLTLPTPELDCPAEFSNFDVEVFRRQTYGELPWSSCDLPASAVDIDEAQELRSSLTSFHSCFTDNSVFRTYDLDSYGTTDTLSHLDVTSSGSLDRNILELDRFCNHTPLGHPASLVAQNCIESAPHPGTNADAPILGDPTAGRLGNGFSRFGRYLMRRIKLFSLSGTQHKHRTSNSNGTELRSVKKARIFSIRGNKLPNSRDLVALDNPTEEDQKKQAEDKKLGRHSLISFVRGGT